MGLIGANGAGKTTTVECIQGLRKPDAGILRVLGYDPVTQAGELRPLIGSQLQDSALPDRLRVAEAVALFGDRASPGRRRAAGAVRAGAAAAVGVRLAERRGAAAAVPGPRAAEPAAAGHPGRADPGPGPGGAAERVGRRAPAARRGHHGAARDPRDGRGRGAVRPGRGDARGTRTRRGGAGGPGGSARRDGDDPLQHAGCSGAAAGPGPPARRGARGGAGRGAGHRARRPARHRARRGGRWCAGVRCPPT